MNILLERCEGQYLKREEIDERLYLAIPLGSIVRLTSDAFPGHEGKVCWTHDDRVHVMLNIFGREVKVKTKIQTLEIVSGVAG